MASVLFKTNERNKILRHRLLEIQEEERRILSQELHDELGQTITAIKAVAASIPNKPTLQKRHLFNEYDPPIQTFPRAVLYSYR